ncbi:unnamed protein product, partial [Meganyctiphanes norvegica]
HAGGYHWREGEQAKEISYDTCVICDPGCSMGLHLKPRAREFGSNRSSRSSSRITIGEVLSKVPVSDVSVLEKDHTMLGNQMNHQDGLGAIGPSTSSTSLMTNTSVLRPTSPSYPPPPPKTVDPTCTSHQPILYYPSSPTHNPPPISFHDPISLSHLPISYAHCSTTHQETIKHPTSPSHLPPSSYQYQSGYSHQTLLPSPLSLNQQVNFNDQEFPHHPRSPTHPPPNPLHGPSSPPYPPPNFLHGPISPTHPPPDLPPLPISSIHSPMYPPLSYIHGPSSPTHPPPNSIHGPSSPTHPPPNLIHGPSSPTHPPPSTATQSPFLHRAIDSNHPNSLPVTSNESLYQPYAPPRFFPHPPSVPFQQNYQSSGLLHEEGNASSEPQPSCEKKNLQNIAHHSIQGTQIEQSDSNTTQKTTEEGSQINKRGKVGMTVGMSDLLTFTFQHEHFPTSVNMARLAKMMGAQWAQVRNWFTNRRLENKKAGVHFRDKTLNYCPYCRIQLKAPKEQKAHLFDPEHIKNVLGVEFQGSKDDPDSKKKIFWKKFPDDVDAFSKISGAKILAVGYSDNSCMKPEEGPSEDLNETPTKETNVCKEVKIEVKQENPDIKQESEEFITASLEEEIECIVPTSSNISEENQSSTQDISMTYVSVNKRMAGGKVIKPIKVADNQDSKKDKESTEKGGCRNGQGIGFNLDINQEPKQKDSLSSSPRTKADMREDLRRSEKTFASKQKYELATKREKLSNQNSVINVRLQESKSSHKINAMLPDIAVRYHKESKIKAEGSQLYRAVLKQSILCHEDNLIVGYQCPNCPKVFHTEWMMMKHSLTHFEFQCEICENSFNCLADLQNHLHEHLTLAFESDYHSQFSCNICHSLQCVCAEQNVCKPCITPKNYSKPQTAKRSKKTFITKPNKGPNDHLKVTLGSYKRKLFPNHYKESKEYRKTMFSSTKNQSDLENDHSSSQLRLLKNIQPLPNESNIQKQSCKIYTSVSKPEEFVGIKNKESSHADFSKENSPLFVPRTSKASNIRDKSKNENSSVHQIEIHKQNSSGEYIPTSLVPEISNEVEDSKKHGPTTRVPQISYELAVRKKRGRKPGGANGKNSSGNIYKDADYYYLCEMCDSTFLSKAELNEHMFFHRLKSRSRRGDKRPIRGAPLEGSEEPITKKVKIGQDVETIDIGGFERFKCPLCKGHFASIQDLNRHRTQAHAQQDEIKTEGGTIEVLKCSYCDKLYRRERELLRHLKHGCKGTPKELMDQLNEGKSLYAININSGKPPFTIVIQDATRSASTPILNMQEGPIVCLYCGKVVKRMREMKRHVSVFCRKVPKNVKMKVSKGVSLLDLGFKILKNEINTDEMKDYNSKEYDDSLVIKNEPIETISEPSTSENISNSEGIAKKNVFLKSHPKSTPQKSKWELEALRSISENSSISKTYTGNSNSNTYTGNSISKAPVTRGPYRYGQCPYCKMFYTKQYILNHVKEKCPELSDEYKSKIKGVTSIEQAFEILNVEEQRDDLSETIKVIDDSPETIEEEESPEEQYVNAELDKDDYDYDPIEDAREHNVSLGDMKPTGIAETKLSGQGNTCRKCGEMYSSQAKLIAHSSVHHGPKKNMYRCRLCNAKLQKYRQLREHVWEHTKESPYRCHVCKSTFSASDNLILHLNTQHKYFDINEKSLYKWLPGKYGQYRTISDIGGYTDSSNMLSCDDNLKFDSGNNDKPQENVANIMYDKSEKEEIKDITDYDLDMVISEITKTERIKLPGNKHVKISAADSKMLIEGLLQTKRYLMNMRNIKSSNTNTSDASEECIGNNTEGGSAKNINRKKKDNLNIKKNSNFKDKVLDKRTSKSPCKSLTLEDTGETLDSVVETVQINDSDLS